MPTTHLQSHASTVRTVSSTRTESKKDQTRWEKLEFYRFSLVVGALAAAGCGGGVAAFWAISMPVWVLALTVCGAMLTLSFVIGVAPVKWITYTAVTAVLIDLLVIVSGLML